MKNKFLTTAAIALACTNFANAGTHGGHAQATTPGHSSGNIYDNMYVTLFGGVAMPSKFTGTAYKEYGDPKNTATFGAGVGYKFDRNFRAELTLQKLDIKGSQSNYQTTVQNKYENIAGFVNGYFDVVSFNKLTPYLTAGVGYVKIKPKVKITRIPATGDPFSTSDSMKSKNNFAWNIGAGVRHNFNDNITVDLGYKYLDFGSSKFTANVGTKRSPALSDPYITKLNAHTFNVGVAYNF